MSSEAATSVAVSEGTIKKHLNIIAKANQANDCIARGFYRSAVELLSDCIRAEPDSSQHHANRAAAYFAQGNYEKALADATAAIAKDPTNGTGYIRKIDVLLHTGDVAQADAIAVAAMKLASLQSNAAVLVAVMSVQFIKGAHEDALATARRVLELTTAPELLCKAATVLGASLDLGDATTLKTDSAVARALGLGKTSDASFTAPPAALEKSDTEQTIDRLISEGQRLANHGNTASAITHWESALLLAQVLGSDGHIKMVGAKLASAYRRVGRPERSAVVLTACSEEAEGFRGLANTALANGNLPRALELFSKALQVEIANRNELAVANAHNNIGWVHVAAGSNALAIEAFEKALEKSRDTDSSAGIITALNGLGTVAIKQDRHPDAFGFFSRALDALPTLHEQLVGDFPDDDSKHSLYRALFSQTYRGVVEMYTAAGKPWLALEWAERSKNFGFFDEFNARCQAEGTNDVTVDEIVAAAATANATVLSYTFLSRSVLFAAAVPPKGKIEEIVTKTITFPSSLQLDLVSFAHQVAHENNEKAAESSFAKWIALEDRKTVAEGKQLRPSREKLAKLFDTLVRPFGDAISSDSKIEALVIIPHGPLVDLPWSEFIIDRNDPAKRLANDGSRVTHSLSAAEWIRQLKRAKQGPISSVCFVKDATVPNGAELEAAIGSIVKAANGSADGAVAALRAPGETSADVVHLTARCTRVDVAKAHEARVDTILGRKLVSRKGPGGAVAVQAIGDVGLQGHGPLGWLFFSDAAAPFAISDDIAVVKNGKAIGVHQLASTLRVPDGATVILDLVAAEEDLYVEGWSAPLIRSCFAAGAGAVIVVALPTTKRIETLRALHAALRVHGSLDVVVKAVNIECRKADPANPNPIDAGALALFL